MHHHSFQSAFMMDSTCRSLQLQKIRLTSTRWSASCRGFFVHSIFKQFTVCVDEIWWLVWNSHYTSYHNKIIAKQNQTCMWELGDEVISRSWQQCAGYTWLADSSELADSYDTTKMFFHIHVSTSTPVSGTGLHYLCFMYNVTIHTLAMTSGRSILRSSSSFWFLSLFSPSKFFSRLPILVSMTWKIKHRYTYILSPTTLHTQYFCRNI